MKTDFTRKLLKWNAESNDRSMPWKKEKDPYKIWLSEIILQQTRVEQGLTYYNRYIEAFPTVHHLAKAPEHKIYKLWEGLGYYNRCKNLISTARVISDELQGQFPETYEHIRSLKGIGPYTAAAIASFAFNLPHAVVDGNVYRVLSRYFGISAPTDTADGKAIYHQLAEALLDRKQPGEFNQAIMDFGAVVCKPKAPLCTSCVQQQECEAFKHGWVDQLPVRAKSLAKKTRWFYYFIIQHDSDIYLRKRTAKDIWRNLYEFALYESDKPLELTGAEAGIQARILTGMEDLHIDNVSRVFRQQLTHQTIVAQFVTVNVQEPLPAPLGFTGVDKNDLSLYPFPAVINAFLAP